MRCCHAWLHAQDVQHHKLTSIACQQYCCFLIVVLTATACAPGLAVTWILMLNVMVTYKQKLDMFLSDLVGEGEGAASSVPKLD